MPTATERIQDLREEVGAGGLATGSERSLVAKLDAALAALEADRGNVACNTLGAFVNEAQAQVGGRVPTAIADALIAEAEGIRRQLGC